MVKAHKIIIQQLNRERGSRQGQRLVPQGGQQQLLWVHHLPSRGSHRLAASPPFTSEKLDLGCPWCNQNTLHQRYSDWVDAREFLGICTACTRILLWTCGIVMQNWYTEVHCGVLIKCFPGTVIELFHVDIGSSICKIPPDFSCRRYEGVQ